MSVGSPRRYFFLKRIAARRSRDMALEAVWYAKQLAEPGEPLAGNFPFRSRLLAAGYSVREDLVGAPLEELQQAGFTLREAAAVLAAL